VNDPRPAEIDQLRAEVARLEGVVRRQRRHLDQFQQAQALGHVGAWSWDVSSGEIHWSRQVFEIHGLDPTLGEPDLQDLQDLYHPDDVGVFMDRVQACVSEGTPYRLDVRIVHAATQEVRHIEAVGRRSVDADGSITLYGVILDTTERERHARSLEQALVEVQAAREAAEQAGRGKLAFLAQMSHEIRTPMNGVLGTAELLAQTELSAEQDELLSVLRASGEGLLVLLNDVLDVAKIESGKVRLEERTFDLHETLRRIVALLQPTIDASKVSVGLILRSTLPRAVRGDETRVQQIITNLLSNAAKFTPQGRITIRAGQVDDHIEIRVRDTGIGIAEEHQQHLFQPFEQASASTLRQYGGTGLGLSICHSLTELMGGSITLHSALGEGATFVVRLPLPAVAEHELDASLADPTLLDQDALHGREVLVVEDNPVNRMVIQRMLENLGLGVRTAPDGLEALIALRERVPDLVIMDVQMPNMDGLEATRQIRSRWGRGLPVVGLTADVFPAAIRACLDAGMDAHLPKPVRMQALSQAIVGLLVHARAS